MTERAVSDVVGYVLIIGLILTSVGFVYTSGVSTLQDTRNTERVANAERAFTVLQSNANDILHRGAPSRMTEIRLSNARLGPGDDVTINISGERAIITPIVYTADDGTKLVYVQGAIIRVSPDGNAVMLNEPAFEFGARSLVPIVHTEFDDPTTVGGQTRVFIRLEATDRSVQIHDVNSTANVTITTPRPEPWRRYFMAHEQVNACDEADASDGRTELTCSASTSTVVVPDTDVNVAFR